MENFDLLYSLLESKDYRNLQKELKDMYAADIAEFINELNYEENFKPDAVIVFRLLEKDEAAEVFPSLTSHSRANLIGFIGNDELKEIFEELKLDDKVDFLEELPANAVKNILRHSDNKERELINRFLNYKEESAGSLMTVEFITLRGDSTVGDALLKIRETGIDKEIIYTCYVIGPNRKLIGVVSLRDLVTTPKDMLIKDIMVEDVVFVHSDMDREVVADVFDRYEFMALPVVDSEERLLGVITVDDALDVIEKETTEDFHIMAGVNPSESSYLQSSVFSLAKDRLIWLVVLLIAGMFVGGVIDNYQWILAQYLILNSFIPMLTAAGGNAGIQATTLAVRNLSIGEISFKEMGKVALKEFKVGLIVGIIMGLTAMLKVIIIDGAGLLIGTVIFFTMLGGILLAKVVGGIIPILADKVGLDPAVMASSIITTLVDGVTLMIYFNIARLILPL